MPNQTKQQTTKLTPMIIVCALFFIFGFVTWANGTLIPFFKLSFGLSDLQAFFVTFASYMAYFFLSLPSAWILKKTGFKNGIILGLLILGIGSLIFIPAASNRTFGLFLAGIFVQGSALALLQTASNPYLTIIGPVDSAAKRISIAGICNKFAGMIVPVIMGSLFLKNASAIEDQIKHATGLDKEVLLNEVLGRVNTPYIVLAVLFTLFAVIIKFTPLPEIEAEDEEETADVSHTDVVKKDSIFQYPHVFLGALCIFLYVGAEVMAGDIIGVYAHQIGIKPEISGKLTSLTLAGMLVGYITGIFTIPKIMTQQTALKICAVLGVLFSVFALMLEGKFYLDLNLTLFGYELINAHGDMYYSVIFIALLGLANSLMWPAIFPLGIKHLGKFTKTGSAIMIMGIAGGAIWPFLYAILKDHFHMDFQLAFFLTVLPCYLYILFFAIKGHKIGLAK